MLADWRFAAVEDESADGAERLSESLFVYLWNACHVVVLFNQAPNHWSCLLNLWGGRCKQCSGLIRRLLTGATESIWWGLLLHGWFLLNGILAVGIVQ